MMSFTIYTAVPTSTVEAARHLMPARRKSLYDALLFAMQLNDAGQMVAFEIAGDDGSKLSRSEIASAIEQHRNKFSANPPSAY